MMCDRSDTILSLEELLLKMRDGDEEAWFRFVDQYGPRLRRLARGHVTQQDVDDVLQVAYGYLVNSVKRFEFRTHNEALAYLKRTVVTAVIEISRRRSAKKRKATTKTLNIIAADNMAHQSPAPSETLAINEQSGLARKAVEQLEPHYCEVIALHYFNGLSFSEIADINGETENAVRLRHSRAKEELRRILSRMLEEEDRGDCR